uniref:Large ribosomal subunit protein uL4 n=1 Tax=Alexandrium catenella TaxID=2925 RepID=A0A7S1M9G7_ALECA
MAQAILAQAADLPLPFPIPARFGVAKMATARPVISVYKFDNPSEKSGTVAMPAVMASPLRPDLVRDVHKNMSKNKRQAYGLSMKSGYDTAAESWGTGRAVSRLPRVPGGGTHRAGQGAFGNMARGGGMFNPNRVWRRWHRRVNVTKKRHAVVSCLAASALPPLVMARGHRIGAVAELPLVVSDGLESVTKTKQAFDTLKKIGCGEELQRIVDSKKIRAGKGKMRNRRHKMRRGPMVIYAEDNGIVRAMRNIPGVETANVSRLNLLKLAPGGNFGRFLIWTEGAINKLQEMYGKTSDAVCPGKRRYSMPRPQMENADVARIINSDEVQSALRPKLEPPKKMPKLKKNPLKNRKLMAKLNPGYLKKVEMRRKAQQEGTPEYELVQAKKKARIAASKEYNKQHKKGADTFYKTLMRAYESKAAEAAAKKEEGEEAGGDED